ncbi:hypothetical protein ILUMI_01021 [Ignelater luminosus]|uniref:Uncharacterized protein n=1 Tax=Ignelater luminosus TaxID=2038154 RepID=A0A8K0GML2_IGNLU|nr:hypothetical protein ILUMI_01021 [Ignelater luminosus]
MDFENVCRTCLRSSRKLLPLFGDTRLPHKIKTISSVEVSVDDKLPNKVCAECIVNINLSYNFRRVIINSDTELRDRYVFIKKEQCENDINGIDKESGENVNPMFIASDEDTSDLQPIDVLIKDDTIEVEFKDELTTDTQNVDVTQEETDINVAFKKNKSKEPTLKNKNVNVTQEETATNLVFKKSKSKEPSLKNKVYKCDKCNFESLERKKYTIHLQNHIMKMCPMCGKFIGTLNYKKHINSHNDSPVTCKECGKVCKNSEYLRDHAIIHKKINRTCKICGETFYSRRAIYVAHLKTHKSEEERSAKCPLCDKVLNAKQSLKKHIRTHTGERPYPCEFCNKGFSSSYALKTHRRQHTNERPYKCTWCPMAFPQKVSLTTHLKSKHNKEITDNS